MESAMQYVGGQFYYGTGHDAKGFPGLLAQYAADPDHTVDAGGVDEQDFSLVPQARSRMPGVPLRQRPDHRPERYLGDGNGV